MEKTYDESYIKEVLNKVIPNINIKEIKLLGAGFDSEAYLINNKYVFKFPKTIESKKGLIKEVKLLKYLEDKLPLDIPKIDFYFKGNEFFEFGISGYKIINGRILTPGLYKSFSILEKEKLAEKIAEFLSKLHKLPLPKDIEDLEEDVVVDFKVDYEKIKKLAFHQIPNSAKEYVKGFYKNLFRNPDFFNYHKAICHNDLSCNHIIIDNKKNEVIGIIDFGDAAITDRDLDFVYLLGDDKKEMGKDFVLKVLKYYNHPNVSLVLKKLQWKQEGLVFEKIIFGNQKKLDDMYNEGINILKNKY